MTENTAVIDACKELMAESRLREFLTAMKKLGYDREGIAALLNAAKEVNINADTGM